MKASVTEFAMVALAEVLAGAYMTLAEPGLPQGTAVGAPEREAPAEDKPAVVELPAVTVVASKEPVTGEIPAIIVMDSRERRGFWFFGWFTVCRGCANCRIAHDTAERWQVDAIRMDDQSAPAFFPAVVATLRGDKVTMHWRRFVALR